MINYLQLILLLLTSYAHLFQLDMIVPPSRRGTSNRYCKSNRQAIGGTNEMMHAILASCTSKQDLGNTMSPSKHYKFNMQNLVSFKINTWVVYVVGTMMNSHCCAMTRIC